MLILMKAIRDMNLPKFVEEDTPLFNSLFNDLFPNIEMQEAFNEEFAAAIEKELKRMELVIKPEQVKKLSNFMTLKTLVMVTCWWVLLKAVNRLSGRSYTTL